MADSRIMLFCPAKVPFLTSPVIENVQSRILANRGSVACQAVKEQAKAHGESPHTPFSFGVGCLAENWKEKVIQKGASVKAFHELYTEEVWNGICFLSGVTIKPDDCAA